MTRGQLWETLDGAAEEVGGVDFVDSAWARGQAIRRRRQALTGAALVGSALAVTAIVFAAVTGTTEGGQERVPAGTPSGTTSGTTAAVSVRTLAGGATGFSDIGGIAVGPTGTVYVSERSSVRMVTPAGVVTTLAVSDAAPATGAVVAGLTGFGHIAVSADHTVYVVNGRSTIRRIARDGTVSQVLEGAASSPFSTILGIAVDSVGTLYVADNGWVRRVTTDGKVTDVGKCLEPTSVGACGELAVDADGTIVFRTDEGYLVRRMTADGQVTTLAGGDYATDSVDASQAVDGVGTRARFGRMSGFALDPRDRTIYISDWTGLRQVTPDGTVTTLGGSAQLVGPIAIGTNGAMYAAVDDSILSIQR